MSPDDDVRVPLEAAGAHRRTQAERDDPRLSWIRPDQKFFAAGACHLLAWTCREVYPKEPVGIASVRIAGERQVFHTYATWHGWAFDHAGWNREAELIRVNAEFEGELLERVVITSDLATFCADHHHRMPDQYWADPVPRARAYIARFRPPWAS